MEAVVHFGLGAEFRHAAQEVLDEAVEARLDDALDGGVEEMA